MMRILAVFVLFAYGSQDSAPHVKRPNVVFILADDLSMNLVPFMPNLQAMQREGTTFSHYFVTDSLCCPSRSSIFTGQFPHNTGVFRNTGADGGFEAFNAQGNASRTFALALQRAGYRTAMLGKYLNGYRPAMKALPRGWNEWDVAGNGYPEFNYRLNQNGNVVEYGAEETDYLTDVVEKLGSDFMRKSGGDPFFIEIATFAPHAPYIPAPRDSARFPGLTAPRTAAFGARPDANAPAWLRDIPPLMPLNKSNIDRAFRMRAQSVLAIDKMIADVRATLAALGEEGNTYIVFSSDNGYHMGEYSLRPGKMTPYDTDINVPLVVVGPAVRKGAIVNEIVENIDLCPTFDEIGGASSPAAPDGRSLLALLRGANNGGWRHNALIEHHGMPVVAPDDPDAPEKHSANPPTYQALRSEDAMYVEYETSEIGYYDLRSDPAELKNISANLPAGKKQRWHDILRANTSCKGAAACWEAQSMLP